MFLSGRPLWLNREINAADAFVAAWLPGSEGGGVADVLLRGADGRVQHDFRGKLSYSWPRRANQYQNNVGQKDYDPQFAFGYGLTYADKGNLPALSEDPGIDPDAAGSGTLFDRGVAGTGLMLRLTAANGESTDVVHPNATTADQSLAMVAINTDVQEGARRFSFRAPATVALQANTPLDWSRETNGELSVVATVRVEQLPAEAAVTLGTVCGAACAAEVALGPALSVAPRNEWVRLGVPSCLAKAGADMSRLNVPFALRAGKGTTLAITSVVLGTEFDRKVECASQ